MEHEIEKNCLGYESIFQLIQAGPIQPYLDQAYPTLTRYQVKIKQFQPK